ncbi:transposase [Bacillus sp. IT-79MI2]|nr:hypothetical protein BTH41_00600 [Bacillus mycoides]
MLFIVRNNSGYRVRRLLMSENIRKDIQEKIQNGDFNCEKELTLSIISGK